MNKDYLIIPDCHAHPDYHNKRFTWLGKLVADLQPHTVIMLGDWADMPSLCSYDKGTKGYEGARYVRDINAAIDAQEKFFHEIRKRKKKLPRFVMLEGNHEHRINRAISSDFNQLDGIIGLDDLGFEDFGCGSLYRIEVVHPVCSRQTVWLTPTFLRVASWAGPLVVSIPHTSFSPSSISHVPKVIPTLLTSVFGRWLRAVTSWAA
jgi:hypothetical protein